MLNIPPLQQPMVLLTPLPQHPAVSHPQTLSRPATAPSPQGMNYSGAAHTGFAPLGQSNLAGLPTYDPLQGPPVATPQPAENGSVPVGVWIGLACGAVGVVLTALVAILVVSLSGGQPPVVPPGAQEPLVVAAVPAPLGVPPAPAIAPPPALPASPPQGPATSSYPMPASSANPPTALGSGAGSISTGPASAVSADATSGSIATPASAATVNPPDLARTLSATTPNAASVDSPLDPSGRNAGLTTAGSPLGLLSTGVERWRTSPKSNLRGIQRFPDKLPRYGYSWMVELLPYLGHERTYARFDLAKGWSEPANLQMTSEVIPAFLNPADGRTRSKGYPFDGMGLTHYVGMAGIEDGRNVVAGELPRSDPRAGIFGYDEVARPEAITDGQSQTIAIIGSGNLAAPWVQGGGATVRGARAPYFDKITGFGSKGLSGSGAQVMMADGSIRAISADIDPAVFKAMCTMHGAESVDLQAIPFIPAEAK